MSITSEQVIIKHSSGLSQASIAKELGINKSYVHIVLRKAGLLKEPEVRVDRETQSRIQSLYSDGFSLREISEKTKLSRYFVSSILGWKNLRKHSDSNHLIGVRNAPEVTQEQQQMVLGSLLGDGSLSRGKGQRNYHFRVTHSAKQRGYIEHKAALVGATVRDYKNSGFSKQLSSSFVWNHAGYMPEVESLVIRNGKKTVNLEWLNKIELLGVAYWFLDDGNSTFVSKSNCVVVGFATNGFSLDEVEFLNRMMHRFGYETYVYSNSKMSGMGHILRMKQSTIDQFISDMTPYVWPIECMRYKLKTKEMASNRKIAPMKM